MRLGRRVSISSVQGFVSYSKESGIILRAMRKLEGFYTGEKIFKSLLWPLYEKWIGKATKTGADSQLRSYGIGPGEKYWPATSLLQRHLGLYT